MLHKHSFIIILSFFFFFAIGQAKGAKVEEEKKFTVVIDAGHGGKDIGATDNGVKEKDINLKVAKSLEALIKKKLKNTKVIMTRENDTYLTLQQRADKANKSQADIFISIHTNSVDKRNKNRKTVAGSSVYTLGLHKDENNLDVAMRENSVIELEKDYAQKYSGFDPQRDESYIIFEMAQKRNLSQSIFFAEDVQKELVKSGRQDRGVHQAGFWVLWATSMPSILVELDFICNPESAQYISSDKGAKELAQAIFNALERFEDSWRKSLGSPNSDFTEVYIENTENNPENTYVIAYSEPVTKAKTRKHKTGSISSSTSTNGRNVGRRRRSSASRELSLNNNYEKESLIYIGEDGVTSNSLSDTYQELAMVQPSKNEGTKSKKLEKKLKEEKKKEEKRKKEEQKALEKKNKSKRKEDAHNAKVNKIVTVYKIQVLASTDLLNQGNSRFCGLSPISAYKENNLYKYYYGESTSREEIESLLAVVKEKIPDAFIVSSKKSVKEN